MNDILDIEEQYTLNNMKSDIYDLDTMRKVFLVGRSEAGKTTLTQALKGEELHYDKTQYVDSWNVTIDSPGEYIESKEIGFALYCFSFESDVCSVLCGADEPFCIIDPGCRSAINRPFIGIITKCDDPEANVPMVRQWLENAGCERIFEVDSYTGRGVDELRNYLLEPPAPKLSLDEAIYRQSMGISEWEA